MIRFCGVRFPTFNVLIHINAVHKELLFTIYVWRVWINCNRIFLILKPGYFKILLYTVCNNKYTVYNLCWTCLNFNKVILIRKLGFNRIIKVYENTKPFLTLLHYIDSVIQFPFKIHLLILTLNSIITIDYK